MEKNGKGKEYDSDGKSKFEGEFLNNKKYNGKGFDEYTNIIYELKNGGKVIEYYNFYDELFFEGEYLNGEKNGKGKECNNNCIIRLEGEYLNGLRNGKGKEYDYDCNLIFEGEYFNGKRNGTGKEYNKEGNLIFEGVYFNGLKKYLE